MRNLKNIKPTFPPDRRPKPGSAYVKGYKDGLIKPNILWFMIGLAVGCIVTILFI